MSETAVQPKKSTNSNNGQIVQKSIWDNQVAEIRKAFALGLDNVQFTMFVELGRSLNLNPFKREIWAVKYRDQVSVFVGRDGYRKVAQEQPDYNGHCVEAVYSNDKIRVVNGVLEHEFNFTDRGHLVGAYCEVYRKTIDHPFRVMVRLDEYKKEQANWRNMPETMIKKVAESQTLRMAYQGIFAGTYHEAEDWRTPSNGQNGNGNGFQKQEFEKMKSHAHVEDAETVEDSPEPAPQSPEPKPEPSKPKPAPAPELITQSQLKKLAVESREYYGESWEAELASGLKRKFGIEHKSELTKEQASLVIDGLVKSNEETRKEAQKNPETDPGETISRADINRVAGEIQKELNIKPSQAIEALYGNAQAEYKKDLVNLTPTELMDLGEKLVNGELLPF
ncbi:MAG: phage recombination protein Bet [Candidatus Marinimicrobia bacterium]|nr:phage recombination protein Bet [Candidatus Neomarinimicrobiota bacterium]